MLANIVVIIRISGVYMRMRIHSYLVRLYSHTFAYMRTFRFIHKYDYDRLSTTNYDIKRTVSHI